MLIPLNYLISKYRMMFRGIIHVGAHECEEIYEYEKVISRDKILWIEAMTDKVEFCKTKFSNILIEQAVISDKVELVTFNISNNGQSSSILELGTHEILHPHINYINRYQVYTTTLSEIICKYDIGFNFLNIDIQGAELRALKGMSGHLHMIDYIYTEVNSEYVYKDCALLHEIDDYLNENGFMRVETEWFSNLEIRGWGDMFYIRRTKCLKQ